MSSLNTSAAVREDRGRPALHPDPGRSPRLTLRPGSGLAWRIMTLFVVFAAALLIIVGVLLTFLSFRTQRSAVIHTQSEIAKRAALDVSAFLSTVEQSLLVLAQTQSLADLEPAEQREALNQLLETLPTFDELTYVDALGREQAKVSPYHTFTTSELTSQSDNPGFRQAMRGERYLSSVSFSNYSGQPIVSFALPVSDLRQETVGVLMARVNFHRMWNIVTGMEVGETGYAYVVDEQGRLIAYRDISPVLRHEDLSRLPTVAAFLEGRPATAEYRGLAGTQVVGAQTPIAGTPWAVVAELPIDEAYAGLQRMLGLLGLLLLGAIVVAAATGRYLAGYIVRPIETLQAGAAVIGRGDLDHTIEVKTGDEIEALAEAFNTMSRNLRRSREEIERWNRELERQVEERTAALQSANLQLQALARVSSRINAALALPDALEAVAEASRAVLGAGRCAVYLLDPETDELRCELARGVSPAYVSAVRHFYRKIPGGQVIDTRRPLVIRDAANDPRLAAIHESVRQEGYHTVALLPLAHGDESLGVLAFYHEAERNYSADDLELAQTFANQAAIAIKNARLFDATSQRAAELSALYAVASTVSQSLDLDEVLNNALDEVLQLMQTDVGWIYLVDEEMEGLTLSAYRGQDTKLAQEVRWLHFGEGFSGYVAQHGEPLLVKDITNNTEFTPHPAALRGGLRSFAGVPLEAKGRILGVLGVAGYGDRQFTRQETDLLSSIGRQVGIAVENARLYDQSREVAALEERNRLAREIHDTLAQGLTGIVVQLEAAERVAAKRPELATASLERAKRLARRSLEEARRSLWNLRPTPLERLSLSEALQQEVTRLASQDGLEARFSLTGEERRLPPDDELNLYRIAQEALTNVRKHAQAHTVSVELAFNTNGLCLSVTDDGIGGVNAISNSRRNAGLGLVGMRERAHLLGGELHIESPPNGGTKVAVTVPDVRD
ncbi:MAG: GAF domain-containing protein [Chloroflexi bacterium]|nr:MAG: GAF domain-containing protein [Chloroflexota bacterium]